MHRANPEAGKEQAWDDENNGPVLQVGVHVWAMRLAFTLQPHCQGDGQQRGCADSLRGGWLWGRVGNRPLGNSWSLLGEWMPGLCYWPAPSDLTLLLGCWP